mmetsp:Transcript_1197/g.3482  ORF Transcript_1197/g.3482 Transcript_1197/m.3482 type:complete len:203 (+) Transcript_1197:761-1369(+)
MKVAISNPIPSNKIMHAEGTATMMYSRMRLRRNVAIEKPVQASASSELRFHLQQPQRMTTSSSGSVIARPTDNDAAAPSMPHPDQDPAPKVKTILSAAWITAAIISTTTHGATTLCAWRNRWMQAYAMKKGIPGRAKRRNLCASRATSAPWPSPRRMGSHHIKVGAISTQPIALTKMPRWSTKLILLGFFAPCACDARVSIP